MASDVSKALRAKLLSYAAISALVGQRMYPDALLQKATLPAIVYSKISTQRDHVISDVTRLAHALFQFDCYGTTRDSSNDIAHAIRTSGICAYQGTTSSIYFCGSEIDIGDYYESGPPTDGNQEHRYITAFDLLVHYWEAT